MEEIGNNGLNIATFIQLADLFDASIDYLVGRSEKRK